MGNALPAHFKGRLAVPLFLINRVSDGGAQNSIEETAGLPASFFDLIRYLNLRLHPCRLLQPAPLLLFENSVKKCNGHRSVIRVADVQRFVALAQLLFP